jgi:UDP-2,3-diacylglucosamine pyrophosphatase LpxH
VFKNAEPVWSALANVLEKGCELTLMLGNHDLELAFPAVQKRLFERLGNGRLRLVTDGKPLSLGNAIVVHGNEDDIWNHVALRALDAFAKGETPDYDDIVVPGSELVKRVMNPIKADHPWVDLLKPETSALLPLLAVLRPQTVKEIPVLVQLYSKARMRALGRKLDDEDIAAATSPEVDAHVELALELAGVSDEIAARDLFEPLKKLWRAVRDKAWNATRGRMQRALRALAPKDYFDTRVEQKEWSGYAQRMLQAHGAKTVIFGHTHLAKRIAMNGGVYINTGTWADVLRLPPETWAEPSDDTTTAFNQFVDDLIDNKLDGRRRLFATYAQVDHGDAEAQVELLKHDGTKVKDGDLWSMQ